MARQRGAMPASMLSSLLSSLAEQLTFDKVRALAHIDRRGMYSVVAGADGQLGQQDASTIAIRADNALLAADHFLSGGLVLDQRFGCVVVKT